MSGTKDRTPSEGKTPCERDMFAWLLNVSVADAIGFAKNKGYDSDQIVNALCEYSRMVNTSFRE